MHCGAGNEQHLHFDVQLHPAFVLKYSEYEHLSTPGCTMLESMQQRLKESSHTAWAAGCPV